MFDFGTRKIMHMNYTRYLALPKVWTDAMGLEKGGRVNIEMDSENRLIISAIENENPAAGAVPGSSAPTTGEHPTHPKPLTF